MGTLHVRPTRVRRADVRYDARPHQLRFRDAPDLEEPPEASEPEEPPAPELENVVIEEEAGSDVGFVENLQDMVIPDEELAALLAVVAKVDDGEITREEFIASVTAESITTMVLEDLIRL